MSIFPKKRILCVVGTRPEAIKMAPVILALRNEQWADVRVLATAQHRQMLDQVLDVFDIIPDVDLDIMRPNQALPELTARLLSSLDEVLSSECPDALLVQGDTTTVMATALAAFYRNIPVGHVEAGLRTGDMRNPFPEEMNRLLASRLTRWHFAPTESSRGNLIREGYDAGAIYVTGNTVIDALMNVVSRPLPIPEAVKPGERLVLVTAHRRENFGAPFREVCDAIRAIADRHPDVRILYPVHPNPNVSSVAHDLLSNHPRISLCQPLDYVPFISAMKHAHIILTDSGGVQEEAPALAKPVLVMRRETERPEAVQAGVVRLVGTDRDTIVSCADVLLTDQTAYCDMAKGVSPYGDGKAASRIVSIMRHDLTG